MNGGKWKEKALNGVHQQQKKNAYDSPKKRSEKDAECQKKEQKEDIK